jgi:hypothetical protein
MPFGGFRQAAHLLQSSSRLVGNVLSDGGYLLDSHYRLRDLTRPDHDLGHAAAESPGPGRRRGIFGRYPLATIAGGASIVVCVSLALAAYAVYPWAFSPMTNWISDLGNRLVSPVGSVLFRIDMVIVGVGLAAFFLGLRALTHGQRLGIKLLIGLGQVGGFVGSFAIVMTGIYSVDQFRAHALWASIMFISLAVTVMFIGWGLYFHPRMPSSLAAFAFAVCAMDVISIVDRSHWLEWVAVPLLLVFVAQLSYGTWKLAPSREPSAG